MKITIYKRYFTFFLLFLFLSLGAFAQVTTGIWKGELYNDVTKKYTPLELVVTIEKSGFVKGYSYVTYDYEGQQVRVLKKVKIAFHNKDVAFEDLEPLSDDTAFAALKKTRLSFATAISGSGVALSMKGIWKTIKTDKKNTQTGTLLLSKVDDFTESEVFKELKNLDRTKDLSFNKKREPEVEIIDLAKLDAEPIIISPSENKELKKDPDTISLVAKVPNIPIKEAVAAIKEKKIDTPAIVAVVEKKSPSPVAIKKPVEEKKLPPPVAVTKTVVEKKPLTSPVAKVEPVKKSVPAKTEPIVVKKPVTAPPVAKVEPVKKTVTPPPVVAAVKKPEAPPAPVVVKKELPVQVFAAPDKDVAADVFNRKTTTGQSVEYQSDSLILTLYDNGEIDGDTVSVLMNGKAIFSKAGLSTRPNRKTIYITPDMPDSLTLVMYAENLGSIPPNTGLLVVGDGDKVYELRFSADLKTNAAIIFRRKRQ